MEIQEIRGHFKNLFVVLDIYKIVKNFKITRCDFSYDIQFLTFFSTTKFIVVTLPLMEQNSW